ncbi:MAG: LysR family transcriptional regulator [Burkholderiaceae bacterium]
MNNENHSIDDLQWFIKIAEAGSLSRAARQLDVPKSTLSRRLARMEAAAGTSLVKRNTRAFSLTDAGQRLVEATAPLIHKLNTVTQGLFSPEAVPSGRVRLAASATFGKVVLLPLVTDYLHRHENLALDVKLSNRHINIVEEGIDLAVRIGELADSSLKARSVGTVRPALFASPAYAKRHGLPRDPSELSQHAGLLQSRDAEEVKLRSRNRSVKATLRSRLTIGPSDALLDPTLDGLGIAVLPEFQAAPLVASGQLVRVLEDWQMPPLKVHLVYPAQRHQSHTVRALMAFLVERLPGQLNALSIGRR